jgi:hypothetical protein
VTFSLGVLGTFKSTHKETTMFIKLKPEQHVVAMTIIGDTTDIGAAASKALAPGNRYRYSTPIR